jgi:RND family efflux transporter MFP subunit
MSEHPQKPLSPARFRWVWRLLIPLVVALVAAGLMIRQQQSVEVSRWTEQQAVPVVVVVTPQRSEGDSRLVLPGTLQPYIDAPILARVNGYLKRWYHDIGERVKAGEMLAEIDTPELDQQLEQARADLNSAKTKQQLAAITAKRWSTLLATDSVSRQDADEKQADLDARKAETAAAKANVDRIEALEAFKRVRAPFAGIITARKTDQGSLISAGSGTELFNLASIDPLRLFVPVAQSYVEQIKVGMKAVLVVPEHPGQEFQATVARTSGAISGNAGTLLVELAVTNKQGLLTPGGYAQVTFQLPQNLQTLKVPATTLILRKGGVKLAVLEGNDHVRLRSVTVGRDSGSEVEILSGLNPEDRVVASPPDSLEDGDKVRLISTAQPQAGHP